MRSPPYRDPDPAEWPTLEHAQRIIDSDLAAMPDAPICISIRQDADGWIGAMWQDHPGGYRLGVFGVIGQSQAEVVRHLAAIIKANRVGGVVP